MCRQASISWNQIAAKCGHPNWLQKAFAVRSTEAARRQANGKLVQDDLAAPLYVTDLFSSMTVIIETPQQST